MGLKPEKTSFGANQVNKAPLNVVGRVSFDIFHGDDFKYQFQALVCSGVGRVCIGGNPLLRQGITPLPSKKCILMENSTSKQYVPWRPDLDKNKAGSIPVAGLLRSESTCTVYPGECLKVKVQPQLINNGDASVFISPRPSSAMMNFVDSKNTRMESQFFPLPQFTNIIDGHVYLPNTSNFPVNVLKNQHLADLRIGLLSEDKGEKSITEQFYPRPKPSIPSCQVEDVILDPDNLLSDLHRGLFKKILNKFKDSFS